MTIPPRRYSLVLAGYCGLLSPLSGSGETFDTLPPPPAAATGQSRQQYMLALIINDADNGRIVPVAFNNGHYYVGSADLAQAGLPTDQLAAAQTDVSAMPGVAIIYDRQRQRLLLKVPPEWLPGQAFTGESGGPRYPARTSTGALLNYDVYGSRIDGGDTRLSAWNEWRMFGQFGHLSTDGVLQRQFPGRGGQGKSYVRYDTYWANQDEANTVSWKAGDLITSALTWSSSVRIGGVQIARDFTVRPDIITYPLPSFAGQAAVPTTVDVFVNGYRAAGHDVRPGPYTFTDLPFINGAGEAVVVTTDALGRRVTTTRPFYVASKLLKPGLPDYSISAGVLRRNYGLRNADYGTPVAAGSYRQAVNDGLTLEGHGEGARSLALAGAGGLLKLRRWGVANAALSHSAGYGESGNQYDWGYQYNARDFSLGAQYTLRGARFRNLTALGDGAHHLPRSRWSLSRRSTQYYASVALDQYGSIGATYINIHSAQGEAARLGNLSWSKNIWRDTSLFASATYDYLRQGWSGALSLVIPLNMLASASLGMEREQQGALRQRAAFSRAMPTDGGFSWDLSYARQPGTRDYRQATLQWRNSAFETAGGFYASGDQGAEWGDINGAVVLMDGHLLAANGLSNAFVLVKTGYPDIPVQYENQAVGSTNRQGYLLIPGISAYYPAKYDINTLSLPPELTANQVEQRVAVRRRSGYLLSFPVTALRAANVVLHDQYGVPLPIGTRVLREGHSVNYVGWDGIAWLDNLAAGNPLRAITPDGQQCTAQLALPGGKPRPLQTYGPLICPLPPSP